MSERFIAVKDITTERIRPSSNDPTALNHGGKILWMNYQYPDNSVDRLQIATPVVSLPFGLSEYKGSSVSRWSCDISFYGMDQTPERPGNPMLKMLYDKCIMMDNYLLDLVEANSEKWFGRKKTRELLAEMMTTMVRDSNPPGKYAPTLKVHANPDRNDIFPFRVFTKSGEEIPCLPNQEEALKAVPERCRAQMLLSFPSIWLSGNSFGWSCRVKQVVVQPSNRILSRPIITDIAYDDEGNLIHTNESTDMDCDDVIITATA